MCAQSALCLWTPSWRKSCGLWCLLLSAFGPLCYFYKQLLWRRAISPFPFLKKNNVGCLLSTLNKVCLVTPPPPHGSICGSALALRRQWTRCSQSDAAWYHVFWHSSMLFQFSSQKWLRPRLFTTQVLVLSAYVLLSPCKCSSLTRPPHRCLFINPAAFRFWTCCPVC